MRYSELILTDSVQLIDSPTLAVSMLCTDLVQTSGTKLMLFKTPLAGRGDAIVGAIPLTYSPHAPNFV